MINNEQSVFDSVATELRNRIPKIFVVGTEIVSAPPRFPAISFVQTNNSVRVEHSTFESLENVVKEDYKAEVYSNLEKGKEAQTREIMEIISDVMTSLGYERTFYEMIPNPQDETICRKVSRYTKNNVI